MESGLPPLTRRHPQPQNGHDASALGASVDLFLLLAKLCGHHDGLQVRCGLLDVGTTCVDGCDRSY